MRRFLISVSTVVATVVAMAFSVPAAFAMRVAPPADGPNTPTPATVVGHSQGGLAGWELALVIVAAAVLVAASVAMTISRRRHVPHPAAL